MIRVPVRQSIRRVQAENEVERLKAKGRDPEIKPVPEVRVWLEIVPPEDLSEMPQGARRATLGMVVGMGSGRGRPATTEQQAERGYMVATQLTVHCVRAVIRLVDGEEQRQPVKVVAAVKGDPAPGVLPLAAIAMEERVAILTEVRAHLDRFRHLLE